MKLSSLHYFPLAWPFMVVLLAIFIVVLALVELRVLRYVYERMGIPPRYVLLVLLLSLVGSAINVPIAELPPEEMVSDRVVEVYGVRYVIPEVKEWPRTILAVNVGGALIPVILSFYLMIKNQLYLRGLIAVGVVTLVVHHLATPVRGLGISVPTFIPPVVAAAVAMLLAWRQAPPLAYIAGSLGTLIGGDLLNLGKIQGLGAPEASIGGAGTFDGVFLSGILAVLLAPMAAPAPVRPLPEGTIDDRQYR